MLGEALFFRQLSAVALVITSLGTTEKICWHLHKALQYAAVLKTLSQRLSKDVCWMWSQIPLTERCTLFCSEVISTSVSCDPSLVSKIYVQP